MKRIFLLSLSAFLAIGCSSKSEFYRLGTYGDEAKNAGSVRIHRSRIVGVAEVSIADYLDKSQIVAHLHGTHYRLYETRRWLGALDKNIQRFIVDALQSRFPSYTFLPEPWSEPLDARYKLYVSIDRFDTDEKGTGVLAGRWSLFDVRTNRFVAGRRFHVVEHRALQESDSVRERTEILNRLMEVLATRMAKGLKRSVL